MGVSRIRKLERVPELITRICWVLVTPSANWASQAQKTYTRSSGLLHNGLSKNSLSIDSSASHAIVTLATSVVHAGYTAASIPRRDQDKAAHSEKSRG